MNKSDITRDYFMLKGKLAKNGYDWWWHSFTAKNKTTGELKSFYIEYFLCNPALAEEKPLIAWHNNNGKKPSYCMVNVGFWGKEKGQLHNFYPWSQVRIDYDKPLNLKVGNCVCTENHISGFVSVSPETAKNHPEYMSDCGEMSWDISVDKQISYNVGYGASKFFRKINAFEMFWHAEGMKTIYNGVLTLNGEQYIVEPETCYGYADKNWGTDFTSPWVWLSSNDLVSNLTGKRLKNSVFEVGGGTPKVFGISLSRKLLGQFYYEGKDYEFNFSKFWTGSKTYFKCTETDSQIVWNVTQTTFKAKMQVEIYCDKSDMIFINYESPNGKKLHNRLWNSGCGFGNVKLYKKQHNNWVLIDDIKAAHVGCEYGEYEKS